MPPDRDALLLEAWAALKSTTTTVFERIVATELGPGASSGLMGFVHHLAAADAPLTPRELAQVVGVTPATVTGAVDRLEKGGFVARRRDTEDRRVVRVSITPLGRDLQRRWHGAIVGHLRDVFAPLSDDDIGRVAALLGRVAPPLHGPPNAILRMMRHDVSEPPDGPDGT